MEPAIIALGVHFAVTAMLLAEASEFGFRRTRRNQLLCLLWGPVFALAIVLSVPMGLYVLFGDGGLLRSQKVEEANLLASAEA